MRNTRLTPSTRLKLKAFLLIATFGSLASIGHAQVLLTDNFDRGSVASPVALNGSSPTSSASPESWTADPSITTDGTQVLLPNTGNSPDSSVLGYIGIPGLTGSNLNLGSTYNLSFTFTQPANTDPSLGWTAAGFGTFSNTADAPFVNGNTSGFFALDNGTIVAIFDNVGGGLNLLGTAPVTGNDSVELTIQIGASADTLSAIVNGNSVTLVPSSALVNPMTEVFVGDDNDSGTIKSLSLDEVAVPEPSTYAMLLGALLLTARMRGKLKLS